VLEVVRIGFIEEDSNLQEVRAFSIAVSKEKEEFFSWIKRDEATL
jgi:hypothetical protein